MTDLTPLPARDPVAQVLAVPGVAAVFPVHVVAHLRETLTLVAAGPEAVDRVEITTSSGITRVRARIAADRSARVPDTGRAVADTLLERAPAPDSLVTVQIAHID